MAGIDDLWWRDDDARYIRARDVRYPGAVGIEPEWTLEAAQDPRCASAVIRTRGAGPAQYG